MATASDQVGPPGVLARWGGWMAHHMKPVLGVWLMVLVGLGAAAPSVFDDLAGAGWQADGSESVAVRDLAQEHFGGNASSAIQVVIHTDAGTIGDDATTAIIDKATDLLEADDRIADVMPPTPGVTVSQDGRTGILIAGAAADTDDMVRLADELSGDITDLATDTVEVFPTGQSMLWSDFNKANHDAMMKAEMMSWPVTLIILVIAFGSLVAAGLPLMLTIAGLVASAGALVLLNSVSPISVWAMNFALMFALALGIDYALFIVARFRDALRTSDTPKDAVVVTYGTAGKAVLLSGLTVLISLSAVLLVPAPAVQTMAVGIMLAVVFVLAATFTLLPAVLGALGPRVNAVALPFAKRQTHRSPVFARWATLLRRHPLIAAGASTGLLIVLCIPVIGLKVAMPSIAVVPEDAPVRQGYHLVQDAMGEGAPGMLQVIVDDGDAAEAARIAAATDGIGAVTPTMPATDDSGLSMFQAVPEVDPSDKAMNGILEQLRDDLPGSALVGGAPAENIDLQDALDSYFPLIVGVILLLGFLLLLIALRAPLIAVIGTVVSLLSTGAAFGVARLIFQNGDLSRFLGFEPQGFLDGWGPVFFFAMIFAVAMDYTVFLLATVKEHHEIAGDSPTAVIEGMAHSGRIIFAAAAVMVAVFFTFALAEPLPPKEMGIILGTAVLLDALLIRLVLLPAVLILTGPAAWWSPAWLRRMLPDISFSH
ncbi:MMPL family transporter [Corynebacterium nuruki]|uniref:MMPL family transporter n=1 Tax=Corynebacterium nuruki TaxID=1032851 RepID=A0A3D4SWD5_9CORY|nr:MMPL family transporter [Corynebacterium nuruki]MDN6438875.1 MMPL family transporter [Corynebacterium nuruki]HCT13576.1 MMPL family transporter [Corynebacterium nuruki]